MEIDPNDVLRQFIRLCNSDHALLQHYLASNSVLEWFGRTVRGRNHVYPYFRFDLCQQYEHEFEKAERCEAFENKPSHLQTRILSEADKISVTPIIKPSVDDIPATPFQRISTPKLPKLGRGKNFIPSPETPPTPTRSKSKDNITPPQNVIKHADDDAPPTKRMKIEENLLGCAGDAGSSQFDESFVNTSEQEKGCDTRNEINLEIGQGDCIMYPSDIQSTSDTGYSEIMYIEAVGFLRMRNKTKHRGVTDTQSSLDTSVTTPMNNSSSTNDLTNSPYARKTKLKLSYRIQRHENQLQFALIVYEHLSRNPATRRNLLCEFQKTTDGNDVKHNTKPIVTSSASKPRKSLKRSLRLF